MTQTVDSADVGEKLRGLLRDLEATRQDIVVERDGKPVAALVPINTYLLWKQKRDEFFAEWEAIAKRANLSEDEAMELALREQRAHRAGL